MSVGYELYREVRDYAPGNWDSGMLVAALIIADDANDITRRSWIDNELLCYRTRMGPTGIRAALQRLAKDGYEFRVGHGTDKSGRIVYAVKGHSVDYLVPQIIGYGDTTASPSPVDNQAAWRHHSVGMPSSMATPQPHYGDTPVLYGDTTVSPLSSDPLTIPSTEEPDVHDSNVEVPPDIHRPTGNRDELLPIERSALAAARSGK